MWNVKSVRSLPRSTPCIPQASSAPGALPLPVRTLPLHHSLCETSIMLGAKKNNEIVTINDRIISGRNVDLCTIHSNLNFYWRFIKGFYEVACLLNNLMKKGTPFHYREWELAAFKELKCQVTSALVLVLPNTEQPFWVEADSSDFTIRVVLSQLSSEDRKWHLAAFLSKSLSVVILSCLI